MAKDNDVNVNIKVNSEEAEQAISKTGDAAKDVLNDFGLMDTGIGKMASGVMAFGQKAISVFKGIKGAAAATGIGALLIAVTSLVAYFTKTEKGAQSLRKAMAALGQIVSGVVDTFVKIGETLMKIGKIIGKVVTGQESLKDAWKESTQVVKDAVGDIVENYQTLGDRIKESIALQERENQLKVKQREFLVEEARLQVALSEARLKTNDQTLTAEERLKALNDAQSINNQLFNERIRQAKEEYELQKNRNALASSTEEDLQKEAELQANLIKLEADRNAANKEFSDQKSALIKAEADKAKAAEEAAKKAAEEEQKRLDEAAKKEVERKQKVNDEIDKLNEEHYLATLETEAERRQAALDLEQEQFEEDLARRLANQEITEAEMANLKEAYMLNWKDKKKALDDEILKDAEETAAKEKEIEKAKHQAKMDGYLAGADALLSISDSIFGETKAAAIAEAVINTYKSATSAYSSLAGIPVVGPALGALAAAAAVVAGIKNITTIKSTNKKSSSGAKSEVTSSANQNPYALGGWITGSSHQNGGVSLTAEGGEYIVNKRTMENPSLGGLVIAANQLGNAPRQMSQIQTGPSFEQVAAMINAQQIYVVESEMTNKQKKVEIRESQFKI